MYVTVNLVEIAIAIFATVTIATIVGFALYDRYGHKK